MTTPNAQSIEAATQLSGIQRQWVKAVALEAARAAVADVRKEMIQLIASSTANAKRDEEMLRKLNQLEQRFAEDDKYTLTPAKLKTLMKKMGIE